MHHLNFIEHFYQFSNMYNKEVELKIIQVSLRFIKNLKIKSININLFINQKYLLIKWPIK